VLSTRIVEWWDDCERRTERTHFKALPCKLFSFSFLGWDGVGWDWVHVIRRTLTGLLQQFWMVDEYWALDGTRIAMRSRSIRRKSAPLPVCSVQTPQDLTFDRIWLDTLKANHQSVVLLKGIPSRISKRSNIQHERSLRLHSAARLERCGKMG
jgi:hypothetical protein